MLQRTNRFHGLGSVRPALKYGARIRGRTMAASVLVTKRPSSRFAVLISKKVSKRAVVRNRIRRRVFEVIRDQLPQLTSTPHDIVISAFDSSLATCDFKELEREVVKLLSKAGLYS